jgi:hypothetical protein
MSITFSSCFYIIKSKFDPSIYIDWMNNFISIVNNFNLVIYTDDNSCKYIDIKNNPKIRVIIKPIEQFYNYKYKDFWIDNHTKNYLLNDKSTWELNMLWSEKIWFVNETIERKYFDTEFYGWCDIGYFRNRINDTPISQLSNWGTNDNILQLIKRNNKICYGCINNNANYMNYLYSVVNNKNDRGLPIEEIPAYQNSVAGGFFILHKDKIKWWLEEYNKKLILYFENDYLVKDDQIILIDCILSNIDNFYLFKENEEGLDNWFMFQRILS